MILFGTRHAGRTQTLTSLLFIVPAFPSPLKRVLKTQSVRVNLIPGLTIILKIQKLIIVRVISIRPFHYCKLNFTFHYCKLNFTALANSFTVPPITGEWVTDREKAAPKTIICVTFRHLATWWKFRFK
jgi:hypothetical protein